jgi:flavin reductase (DIM6/NTAB) family NADH-FMN oxidoreductase RutF
MLQSIQNSQLSDLVDPVLWVVTSGTTQAPAGLISTSVTQISISRKFVRYQVALAKTHHTCQEVLKSRAMTLHLIDLEHADWVAKFGLLHGHKHYKFSDLSITSALNQTPILNNAPAWATGHVLFQQDLGDRISFIIEIDEQHIHRQCSPLTWNKYANMIPQELMAKFTYLLEEDIQRDEQLLSDETSST